MRNGLVEGVSLRAVLRESGAMAPEAAASVLAGMLVTLPVVHGDVSPEHVRVDASGGLALTDFGGGEARFVPNSPTYLAPERLSGAPASAGADVFSATAVFFECLTGESPFVAATRDDLAALHEYAEVIAEFAPPELRAVAQHGLAPDAGRRAGSPHAFLDEVTTTAAAVYGTDWQQRGRALLGGWAAAAARTEGVELVAAPGPSEAPPVGEPIDAALLGLEDEAELAESVTESPVADAVEIEVAEAAAAAGDGAEEMPPPMGEPIDEAVLSADDEASVVVEEPVAVEEPVMVEEPVAVEAEAPAEEPKDYDWFTGKAKPTAGRAHGAEADVLAAFDDARAERVAAEPAPEPYTPSGFDVFADRSGGAAEVEPEPVSGHWDEPETVAEPTEEGAAPDSADAHAEGSAEEPAEPAESLEGEPVADGILDAVTEAPEAEPAVAGEADIAFDAFASGSGETTDATPGPAESAIMNTDALLTAFEAFAEPPTSMPEPLAESADPEPAEPEPEPEPEPLPKRDPLAGLQLETLAVTHLFSDSTAAKSTTEAESTDPQPAEAVGEDPESAGASSSSPDLEDDWVIPAKPGPKVPRSLSAFAVSLPSLPRPKEAEEPKPPVQTSAPDDWFRPGVAEPVGADAHHTQVLNPDRDNTIESEATRVFDGVPAGLEAGAAATAAASAKRARERDADDRDADDFDDDDYADDDYDYDRRGAPGGSGGPRRKTLIGAVTTAVLLVAGATAVVLAGSGKSSEGTGGTPTDPSATATSSSTVPATPTGTSDNSDESPSTTPSTHRSPTHSKSHSPSTSRSSETATHTSSSPTHSSSSPSSSASSPSSTCSIGILGLPDCGPSTSIPSTDNPTNTGT